MVLRFQLFVSCFGFHSFYLIVNIMIKALRFYFVMAVYNLH